MTSYTSRITPPMVVVSILTNDIKPGGGPAGYTYNLIRGLRNIGEWSEEDRAVNVEDLSIRFSESISDARTSSAWIMPPTFMLYAKQFVDNLTHGLVRLLYQELLFVLPLRNYSNRKRMIRHSDIVVFQGFQNWRFHRYAQANGSYTVYMPHSPTPLAEEYRESCALNGVRENHFTYLDYLRSERYLLTNSDTIVFPSYRASEQYRRFFPDISARRTTYIESGVDEPPTSTLICDISTNEKRSHPFKVLFAGRYTKQKGFDLYNELARLSSTRVPGLEFLSAGSGPLLANKKYVVDLGWRGDIYDLIRSVDVVVIPNRVAYYDLLPLEVAACGRAILFTPVGGNLDQASCLPDCVCAKDASPEGLVDGLMQIVASLSQNATYGADNALVYRNFFTSRHMAVRWIEVLQKMPRRKK